MSSLQTRRSLAHRMIAPSALAVVAAGGMSFGVLAQDATPAATPVSAPAKPAHIHTGTCDEVGEVVAPLSDLVTPTGDALGQSTGVTAETSFSNVPLTLDQILAGEHLINVHQSADEIDVYVACGEIGGVLDANGALVIGLSEQTGSGYSGIAFLTPGADGASTDISVFIANDDE